MEFSPYRSANRLVFADKFQPEILTGSPPPSGASDKKSGGKQAISRFIRQYLENVQSNDYSRICAID